jgi:hypothetical protein
MTMTTITPWTTFQSLSLFDSVEQTVHECFSFAWVDMSRGFESAMFVSAIA